MNENQCNQNTKYSSYNNSQCCDPKDLINPALTENLTINIWFCSEENEYQWNTYVDGLSRRIGILNLYQPDYNLFSYMRTPLLMHLLKFFCCLSYWVHGQSFQWYLINLKWKYTCNYTLLECKALFNWCKKKWSCYHLRPLLLNFQN